MWSSAMSRCQGRRVSTGADRTLADDDLIPPLVLIEDVRPVRRTGVASNVAALVVDRQADDAELLVRLFGFQPTHVAVFHSQRLSGNRVGRVINPQSGDAV